MNSPRPIGWKCVIWTTAIVGLNAAALAQDFRIDTEVFIGAETEKKGKEPVAETLTIFANGMVYDFLLTDSREITLFDPSRGRFNLLDESRQVKTSLSTQDVLEYVLAFESHAAQSKDRLFEFAARPQFQTTTEEVQQGGQSMVKISLTGTPLSYVALGQRPQQPEVVRPYHQFADWFARLNAARPGNLPPGARLALNQALADQGLLPLEVTRTIITSGTFGRERKLEARTRHLVNWTLSGEDRKRIEHAGDCLVTFQEVSFDQYRATTPATAPAKQPAQP
jgi:hypothetical protein